MPASWFLYYCRVGLFIVFVSSWVLSEEVDTFGFWVEHMFVVVQ